MAPGAMLDVVDPKVEVVAFTAAQIPGRTMDGNLCAHRYRVYYDQIPGFSYNRVTCPYVGAASFDFYNAPSTDQEDNCARTLTACKLRFGTSPLPFRGFPGLGG